MSTGLHDLQLVAELEFEDAFAAIVRHPRQVASDSLRFPDRI
jgi:hypothetical protein